MRRILPARTMLLIGLACSIAFTSMKAGADPGAHGRPAIVSQGSAKVMGEIEGSSDPGDLKNLLPGSRVSDAVRLRSDADIDTFGYLLVEIPVVYSALEGQRQDLQDALIPEINASSFAPVAQKKAGRPGQRSRYLYRYRGILHPGDKTPPLFTEFYVPDFDASDAIASTIVVTGYLTQSDHIDPDTADRMAVAWAGL